MPNKSKRSETLVGLFILVGLLMLGALIVQFGRFGDRMRGHYPITLVFQDASGLIKGSEVRMGGAKIGKVAEQPELNDQVRVEVELSIDDRIRIPENSQFQIASATLLGDKLIIVTPPEQRSKKYLAHGARLDGGGPAGLDLLQTQAEKFSQDARKLLGNADTTLAKMDEALEEISASGKRLGDAINKVNLSILSEKNLQNIDGFVGDMRDTAGEWRKASTHLEPALAEAKEAVRALRLAADGARDTMGKADRRIDQLGPALDELPKTLAAIREVAGRAGGLLDRAAQGEGVLGTLAYDHQAKADASAFVRNLRMYGILRYRDDGNPEANDPRNRYRGQRR